METVRNFFNKIINHNVFQFFLLIFAIYFTFSFIERLKAVKFDPVIFLGVIICIIIAFILGQSFTESDSNSKNVKMTEEGKSYFIGEKLYALKKDGLSLEDRQEILSELMNLDSLNDRDFEKIINYLERHLSEGKDKTELIDSVLDEFKKIKQKARDT